VNTLIEKITMQQQCPSKVFLFKEGLFYKAYNQGAYLLRHKKYKVSVKRIKNSNNEVVSIGFPSAVYHKLQEKICIETFESYSCFDSNAVFDDAEFQNWYNEIVIIEQIKTKSMSQKKNGLCTSSYNEIIQQIKNYPLANKTPMEVFVWVASLQSKLI